MMATMLDFAKRFPPAPAPRFLVAGSTYDRLLDELPRVDAFPVALRGAVQVVRDNTGMVPADVAIDLAATEANLARRWKLPRMPMSFLAPRWSL